jgi:short-subunit dehydrogenase
MKKHSVLVTGASSGIGFELAKQFASKGHSVVLSARTTDKLEQLAHTIRAEYGVQAHVIAADLTQLNAPEAITEELKRRHLQIDVLVNNAGFGLLGPYAQLDAQQQMAMIQVNVTALAYLTRLLLPGMIERNTGGILNVASTAAFQAGPNMAVYYATKAFVLSFTEALHEEVASTALHVCCLCPGPTITGFVEAAQMGADVNLFKFGAQSAMEVAQYGYQAFERNQTVAISGMKNRLLALSAKFSPRSVTRKIAMALNR